MIARYIKRLAALIRRRRVEPLAVSTDATGLSIGSERVSWCDVRRLDACKRDIYAGELICLILLAKDGRVVEINEEMPGWQALGEAIERYLPKSLPYTEWTLKLLAAPSGQVIAVFPEAQVEKFRVPL